MKESVLQAIVIRFVVFKQKKIYIYCYNSAWEWVSVMKCNMEGLKLLLKRSHKSSLSRSTAPRARPKISFISWPIMWHLKLSWRLNPLNAELNPICHWLALLGGHHFLHVSRIRVKSLTLRLRVKSLTLRLLMSYIYIYIYIYGAPILDVSRSHTTTHHSR